MVCILQVKLYKFFDNFTVNAVAEGNEAKRKRLSCELEEISSVDASNCHIGIKILCVKITNNVI